MPPLSEKPRPPIVAKPSYASRPTAPLTPKVSSAEAAHFPAPPAAGRRAGGVPAPLLRPTISASAGGGGHTPPPSAPTISASLSNGRVLGTNVAPRSGARQTRVDHALASTPATPITDKGEWHVKSAMGAVAAAGTGAPFLPRENRKQSGGVESKFFYASEARSPPAMTTPQGRPASLVLPRTSSYLHSMGPRRDKGGTQPQDEQGSSNQLDGRFVHANGLHDAPTPANVSPASSGSLGKVQTGQPVRPISPTRQSAQAQALRAPAPLSSNKLQPGQLGASFLAKRRVSAEATPHVAVHSRSGSVESTVAPRLASPTPSRRPSGPSTPASPSIGHFQPVTAMASIVQVAEDLADTSSIAEIPPPQPEMHSPTKSSHSGGGDVSDAVANARRERKVQDLEITNTSLTAINRTLEKQLRKQTMELRRYQRLSRSGWLSAAPSGPSSRMPSSTLSLPAETGLGLSATGLSVEKHPTGPDLQFDLRDSLFDEDELLSQSGEEEEEEEEAEAEAETEMDPSIRAGREVERRKRDEHRLHLDMSKHHQILVDSQKMNQSLKRCLGWTEQLIREGQKALESTVKINDADIGNRFVGGQPPRRPGGADEEGNAEDDDPEGTDAMSETQGTEEWLGEVRSELPKWGEKALHDGDSGVDLPPDGG